MRFGILFFLFLQTFAAPLWGQTEIGHSGSATSLESRVGSQAAEIADLQKQIAELREKSKSSPKVRTESSECGEGRVFEQNPVVVEKERAAGCATESKAETSFALRYIAEYDNGFLIRPIDSKRDPFQLKVNAWIQFRHVGFSPDEDTWTDNAGVTRDIRHRNAFDIERARLVFSGYAVDPRLTYFLHLDGDTDGREAVDFFDYWWAWKCSDALRLQFGKRKVPASRQWLLGARDTRLSDRPLATDFFRPDRSTGLFAGGKLADGLFYEAMIGNGYRTANRNASEINDQFAFAATGYFMPNGAFGKALTDHAISESPLTRIGHSFAWAPQHGLEPDGDPLRESDFVRLSDGTRLLQTGALAPGVTVDEFDVYFYAVDAGIKFNGWSLNSEFYFRWLEDLSADGALPLDAIFQHGFFVEGGRVILPNKLDWNLRYSYVDGEFGDASEYGGGLNWYPLGSPRFKVTFDVSQLDGSPLNNTATEILAGDSGTLFRTQIQCQF